MIRIARIGGLALAVVLLGTMAQAQVPATTPNAKSLQLADVGNVATWRPGGARLMYIKDKQGQWYRIDLLEPCMDLFPGKDPTFVTLTDTEGQRYSGVVIERHQCSVTNLTKMTGPPPAEPYVAPQPKAPAVKSAPSEKK